MSIDWYDEQKIEKIVEKSESRLKRAFDDSAQRDRQMIEAMGGIAAALKELTVEIAALRRDINPEPLDKPAKLAAPKNGG